MAFACTRIIVSTTTDDLAYKKHRQRPRQGKGAQHSMGTYVMCRPKLTCHPWFSCLAALGLTISAPPKISSALLKQHLFRSKTAPKAYRNALKLPEPPSMESRNARMLCKSTLNNFVRGGRTSKLPLRKQNAEHQVIYRN